MARRVSTDPEVRALLDQIAPLWVAKGSVGALQRALSHALAADGSEGRIYPNRLHTLLSEDPARAINSQTLETLRLAVPRVTETTDLQGIRARADALRARALVAWNKRAGEDGVQDGQITMRRVADELGVPPAIVRWVLGAQPAPLPLASGASIRHAGRVVKPDWSFQDDAYHDCLRALGRGPNRKVGMVIPTGGGKTRIAIRVLLRLLADTDRPDAVVLWVTHRDRLREQARRELQRAFTDGTPELPDDAVALLAQRVHIVMLADLKQCLDELGDRAALVVVDEAHHAAAASYQPIFDRRPLRAFFLTATPVRTDMHPLGIDEIAFTISYRELFERGVLVEPTFLEPLTMDGLEWSDEERARDLADYVLDRADVQDQGGGEFVKTLVVASRIEHVEHLYRALVAVLDDRPEHILGRDDIGFVHSGGTSTGTSAADFLDEFAALPRGVLVATAQLLGEGFDDPGINAVVVTYPTTSLLQLMQVAGRCLRRAPEKDRAYVVQVKPSTLAYHYEQRWLYQDISDALHPQLLDRRYADTRELVAGVEQLLRAHHASAAVTEAIRRDLEQVRAGESCALLLTGLPYFGAREEFDSVAEWSAYLVTPADRDLFLRVFNDYSLRCGEILYPEEFLRGYLAVDTTPGSRWMRLMAMLNAMRYARLEIGGQPFAGSENRPYLANVGTTWLRYATFTPAMALPAAFEQFLADVVNRESITAAYLSEAKRWRLVAKIDLPLAGAWAFLLDKGQTDWLVRAREELATRLRQVAPVESFAELTKWRLALEAVPVPALIADRMDVFIAVASYERHVLTLGNRQ